MVRICSRLLAEARDRAGAEAELHAHGAPAHARSASRNSIQAIMRCTYSSSISSGSSMRIAPWTHGRAEVQVADAAADSRDR